MVRYDSISSVPHKVDLIDYDLPVVEFDDSVADFSCFVPTSESVRTLKAGDFGNSNYYDFPDGKDTGFNPPLARQKGVDLAQISVDLRNQQKKLSKAVKEAKDAKALSDELNAKYGNKDSTDSNKSV